MSAYINQALLDKMNARESEWKSRWREVEARAREIYEDARKNVSGRPSWEDLDPDDPYDMGLRSTAIHKALAL